MKICGNDNFRRVPVRSENNTMLMVSQKVYMVSNCNEYLVTNKFSRCYAHETKLNVDISLIKFNNIEYVVDFRLNKYVKVEKIFLKCMKYYSNYEFYGNKLIFDAKGHRCRVCSVTNKKRFIDCFNKYGNDLPSDFDYDRNIFTFGARAVKSARKI